eukprot:jgi/Mesen1/2752/ME000017S02123
MAFGKDGALISTVNPLDAASRTPVGSTLPVNWTSEEVGLWLIENNYGQYRHVFEANHVTGQVLLKLDRNSLAELVPSLGHRLSMIDSIEQLRGPASPRHVGEGVVGGLNGFAAKFMHGLTHLMNDPLDGASSEGLTGLVKGLGSGIAGAIKYPVEGVGVFTRQLGDGLRHTPDAIFGHDVVPQEASGTVGHIERAKPQFLRDTEGGSHHPSSSRPGHVGEGLVMGFRHLGSGLYDGVTGLLTEPMKAAVASSHGPTSLASLAIAKGVAKGFAGLCLNAAYGRHVRPRLFYS